MEEIQQLEARLRQIEGDFVNAQSELQVSTKSLEDKEKALSAVSLWGLFVAKTNQF